MAASSGSFHESRMKSSLVSSILDFPCSSVFILSFAFEGEVFCSELLR